MTATPGIQLDALNSIQPIDCPSRPWPYAKHPFLDPPYHGWISIVSYLDHDLPDYAVDGLVETATGLTAAPDATHEAYDFPAYWNGGIRQFVYYDGHNGYDFNLWYQPVYAAAAGKVMFAAYEYPDGPTHGYGQMVLIDHGNGYVTLYGHLSRFKVHAGERVRQGQEIGISGNTGHSSGPHLHFSVFHNCTATDPYGWTGPGTDPLAQYKGEQSRWLWKRQPLVINPIPHFPGAGSLPVGTATRIALLRLPSTQAGSRAFTRALNREEQVTVRWLRARHLAASIDMLRGAVIVEGASTSRLIYQAPSVLSITTPDTEEGDREDVLAALAHSALLDHHRSVHVARSARWTGYVLRWQGRTVLVGRGAPGSRADLRLKRGGHVLVRRIFADAKTGAYAADLGRMSVPQARAIEKLLTGRGSGGASARLVAVSTPTPIADVAPASGRSGEKGTWWPLFVVLLMLGVAGAGGFTIARRRVPRD